MARAGRNRARKPSEHASLPGARALRTRRPSKRAKPQNTAGASTRESPRTRPIHVHLIRDAPTRETPFRAPRPTP